MKGFRQRLENAREKTGYTKQEVSLKLGFSKNVYGSYELGNRNPSLETLIEIADLFNVSLDYLLKGEETAKQKSVNHESFQKVLIHFNKLGIDDPYILKVNHWQVLTKEDIKELENHFEWVVEKARRRYPST